MHWLPCQHLWGDICTRTPKLKYNLLAIKAHVSGDCRVSQKFCSHVSPLLEFLRNDGTGAKLAYANRSVLLFCAASFRQLVHASCSDTFFNLHHLFFFLSMHKTGASLRLNTQRLPDGEKICFCLHLKTIIPTASSRTRDN